MPVRAWWNGAGWCCLLNSTRWLPRYGSIRTMAELIDYSAFEAAEGPRELAEAFDEHGVPSEAHDTVVTVQRDSSMGQEQVKNLAELAGWELFGVDMNEFTLSDGSWRGDI